MLFTVQESLHYIVMDLDGEMSDAESTIGLNTAWNPTKCLPVAGTQYIQDRRIVTSYRDYRIPCTCVNVSCPQVSAIAYDHIVRHPEFGGPVWMKIVDPYWAEWNVLNRRFPDFTHSVYYVKMMVELWDYYSHIPKDGKSAFTKLLIKTMAEDRRLIIKPELAEKLWDLCPERYRTRFECAARARVENEVQEDVFRYLSHYQWEFEDEIGGVPIEIFFRKYIHRAHESNFRPNKRHSREEPHVWE